AVGAVDYVWPTDGVVVDPFRPPQSRYGPGNRGLEFATAAGSPFWAAADGTVTFAGQVGGRLHVTVGHADGLRTSYSGVRTIAAATVYKGARVRSGQVLGTTGETLHVGVRRGDVYLDPAPIFGPRAGGGGAAPRGRPRLVPTGLEVVRLTLPV
ncbi:MAG TPA: hypothetical protein DEP66_00905, partial [Acidimicrobiaceae bacterium]|nr:hypothetical protein [Acidimicrobiaceae bacterium]